MIMGLPFPRISLRFFSKLLGTFGFFCFIVVAYRQMKDVDYWDMQGDVLRSLPSPQPLPPNKTMDKAQACIHPKLDVHDPVMMHFYTKMKKVQCKGVTNWVYVNNGTLLFSSSSIGQHGEFRCDYYPLIRGPGDYNITYGAPIRNVLHGSPLVSDFFKIECLSKKKKIYQNIHAGVHVNQTIKDRLAQVKPPTEGLGLSVTLLGFDSMSRMSWLRRMPLTREYLVNNLHAIELEGYNILGDGTPAALLPILTGKLEQELPEARRYKNFSKPVDRFPWIWRDFQKNGYVTSWADAEIKIAPFNYRMLGFEHAPTDYFMRPFFLAVDPTYKKYSRYCHGSEPKHIVWLNWVKDIFYMYKHDPKFMVHFYTPLSHDNNNLITMVRFQQTPNQQSAMFLGLPFPRVSLRFFSKLVGTFGFFCFIAVAYRQMKDVDYWDMQGDVLRSPPSPQPLPPNKTMDKAQACIHPKLDVHDPVMMHFYTKMKKVQCKGVTNWVYVNNGTLLFSSSSIGQHGEFKCDYYPLIRGPGDYNIKYGAPIRNVLHGSPLVSDFFKIECLSKKKKTYQNIHAGVHVNQTIKDRLARVKPPTEGLGLSVTLLGFDSMSRMSWLRRMPLTREYLVNNLHAIELEGYNILGDGTPAALLPILTGKLEQELPEARRYKNFSKPVDRFPWIWRDFQKNGYVTSWADAEITIAPFNYRMLGFEHAPTDYFMRPFFLAVDPTYKKYSRYCHGSEPKHIVWLNWVKDIFYMYKHDPKFMVHFYTPLSHDNNNLITMVSK
ncbi:hypothetical protein Btru_065043 [Bulinus truncatus]|nr:hypothetical protein Btru_065043 [Bulinus truncatus]